MRGRNEGEMVAGAQGGGLGLEEIQKESRAVNVRGEHSLKEVTPGAAPGAWSMLGVYTTWSLLISQRSQALISSHNLPRRREVLFKK